MWSTTTAASGIKPARCREQRRGHGDQGQPMAVRRQPAVLVAERRAAGGHSRYAALMGAKEGTRIAVGGIAGQIGLDRRLVLALQGREVAAQAHGVELESDEIAEPGRVLAGQAQAGRRHGEGAVHRSLRRSEDQVHPRVRQPIGVIDRAQALVGHCGAHDHDGQAPQDLAFQQHAHQVAQGQPVHPGGLALARDGARL
jgi:hypothetical protein